MRMKGWYDKATINILHKAEARPGAAGIWPMFAKLEDQQIRGRYEAAAGERKRGGRDSSCHSQGHRREGNKYTENCEHFVQREKALPVIQQCVCGRRGGGNRHAKMQSATGGQKYKKQFFYGVPWFR